MIVRVLAATAGGRYDADSTTVPRRTRRVRVASAASVARASKAGSSVRRPGDWRWSLAHTPSNPSASARPAISRISLQVPPYWGIRTPIAGRPATGRP